MSDDNIIFLAERRPASTPDASSALRGARARSGLSPTEFAAALRDELATDGISADAVTVWEDGRVRLPYRVLDAALRIAESPPDAGSAVAVAPEQRDANATKDPHDIALAYHPDAATALQAAVDLGRTDMTRRDLIQKMAYTVTALGIPSRDWLLGALEHGSTRRSRIGVDELDGIRAVFEAFQQMDVCGAGGERTRAALVDYFRGHVAPLLDGHHAPGIRRELFAAASEHTYLAGWMAYEVGDHGLAQRYLIQALRLADESGDQFLGSHVLAGMSDQATLLGHPGEGLKLARAGQHALRGTGATAALADLYALEARAHGLLGDKSSSLAAIGRAEAVFEKTATDAQPEWARFIDVAYLWGEFANCARDLGLPELGEQFSQRSIDDSQRQGRARRGALGKYGLAVIHLQRGELDVACGTAHDAAKLARGVQSARLSQALADFRNLLRPHRGEPAANAFAEQLATLAT